MQKTGEKQNVCKDTGKVYEEKRFSYELVFFFLK